MMFVGRHNDPVGNSIGKWYSNQIQQEVHGPYVVVGWGSELGKFTKCLFFNEYTGANINVHIYAPRVVTKDLMTVLFMYPFEQLKVERLMAKPPRDNKKMLSLLPKAGFQYEATLKRYYGPSKDNDAIVFVYFKEQWIEKNGYKRAA